MHIKAQHVTYVLYVLTVITVLTGVAGVILESLGALLVSWVCFAGALGAHRLALRLRGEERLHEEPTDEEY